MSDIVIRQGGGSPVQVRVGVGSPITVTTNPPQVVPNIVTSNLVFHLDAGNASSYPGSGTTWSDLSGNSADLTLTNGSYFDNTSKSMVFDGIDDLATRSNYVNVGNNFTVAVWMKPSLLGTTRRNLVFNGNEYGGGGLPHRKGWLLNTSGAGTNNTFFMSIGNDTAYRVAGANTLTVNEWVYVAGTVTNGGETITLFKNGTEVSSYAATVTSSGTISYQFQQFNVGYRQVGGSEPTADPFTGNIAIVQIYNRVLSSAELQQNFNALRSRFGV